MEPDDSDETRGEIESRTLEATIGQRLRDARTLRGLTLTELSGISGLSVGMLSKVENGQISPSLTTLQTLAKALSVPLSTLFENRVDRADVSYVASGEGLSIERRGTRHGHRYQLLGHTIRGAVALEPYLITLSDDAEPYPHFRHEGVEFLHVLSGEMDYRHGESLYRLKPGDSLTFDAAVPHGPDQLIDLPTVFLSIIISRRNGL